MPYNDHDDLVFYYATAQHRRPREIPAVVMAPEPASIAQLVARIERAAEHRAARLIGETRGLPT